jgi:uncharacterized protein YjbI with pentapeptide repeats
MKLVNGIVNSKTVSRLLKNTRLIKRMAIGFGVFSVWFIPAVVYESKDRPVSQLSPEMQEIDKSIKAARSTSDPFIREHFIQREARRLRISSDEYKKLFAIRKTDSDVLPDVPVGNPLSKIAWFYQDLSREQRLKLIASGFVWLVKLLPNLTVLFIGVRFLLEIPQREKQAKYQAWQVVHAAYGQKVSGARIAALEDLRDQEESLAGLTLEEGAVLNSINLQKANLNGAKLNGTKLNGAKLNGAKLNRARLSGAELSDAELNGTQLNGAELINAELNGTQLNGAELIEANIRGTKLTGAKLTGVLLDSADLTGADFTNAVLVSAELTRVILTDADLSIADLSNADLSDADLSGARNLTEDQLKDAKLCRTKLPEGMALNPNRDCKALGISKN